MTLFENKGRWLGGLLVRYVNGRVLKGHICPASQIASHMQVNPSVHEETLFMYRATTGNSLG